MGVNNEPSVMLFYSGMAFRSTKSRESYAPDKHAAWVRESVIVRRIRARDTCAPDAAQRAASRMVRCRAGAARNSVFVTAPALLSGMKDAAARPAQEFATQTDRAA